MTLSPTIQPDDPGHKISHNGLFQYEIPNVSQVLGSISDCKLHTKVVHFKSAPKNVFCHMQ